MNKLTLQIAKIPNTLKACFVFPEANFSFATQTVYFSSDVDHCGASPSSETVTLVFLTTNLSAAPAKEALPVMFVLYPCPPFLIS